MWTKHIKSEEKSKLKIKAGTKHLVNGDRKKQYNSCDKDIIKTTIHCHRVQRPSNKCMLNLQRHTIDV